MNSVNLVGRLTRDANVVNTHSGSQVALFTLAVSNGRDQNGNERAVFIPCQLQGKAAANVAKYMTKGTLVGFEGALNVYDSTKEKLSNGYPVKMFSVTGFRIDLLERPRNADSQSSNYHDNTRWQTQRPATIEEAASDEPDFEEDINF